MSTTDTINTDANTVERQQQFADKLALPMFTLSFVFLVLVAVLIVNNLAATIELENSSNIEFWTSGLLLSIWPFFLLEYLATLWVHKNDDLGKQQIIRAVVCLIPPLRLATPCRARDNQIWLPGLSWRYPGRQLSQQLERLFGKPMLVIALLILPILLLEFGLRQVVEQHNWLMMILHISTGFIWCAFAFEFIIMISATDKKIAYAKKNWIDLAIILLPLISFLRSIRVLRLARLGKVQKLAKLSRAYRMRGLCMKAFRALLLLQFVSRLLGITLEKKLARLEEIRAEKQTELSELDEEIDALKKVIENSD